MAASPKFRKPLVTHIAYYFKDNKMPRTACLLVCLFVSNKRQNGWVGLAQMLTPASQGRSMKINSQKLYIFHTILKINEKKNCESGNFAMLYRRENAGRLYNNYKFRIGAERTDSLVMKILKHPNLGIPCYLAHWVADNIKIRSVQRFMDKWIPIDCPYYRNQFWQVYTWKL